MNPRVLTLRAVFAITSMATTWIHAASPDAGWSILQKRCLECHGPEKQKSGYRLDERTVALRGGDSGRAPIVVGNSSGSALVQRLVATNTDERMPPKGQALSAAEVAAVRKWIDMGAVWPSGVAARASVSASNHWAFQPVRRPPTPKVRHASSIRNPIDAFIMERLDRERLKFSPEAERTTLIRRLYFDLVGLLPPPDRVAAFEKDRHPDAYERLVDELLASPHFGERWGRHWLDLARYADSAGYQIDRVRPGAYYYRDWVIESFNRDQPFDQFTIEQLAGDLLPNATMEQRIATGFHRMTLSNYEDGVDKVEFDCKAKVDRVATTGTTWLGLTVGCAECHTHKYDPITQREFYQLYAFFNAAHELDVAMPNPVAKERFDRSRKSWELQKAALEAARTEYAKTRLPLRQLEWERSVNREALTNTVAAIVALPIAQRTAAQQRELAKHYKDIDPGMRDFAVRLKAHQRSALKYREEEALVLADNTNAVRTFVHVRGDFLNHGEEVQAGALNALNQIVCSSRRSEAASRTPDRLDLARWIVSPENPLTARVAVNRIWQHLLGRGIVNTPEDFGTRGDRPSHPELLDWLASEFQNCGWSRKHLIRLIVTSATYRQSSRVQPVLLERDPQNVLLARQSRFRVESEIVRDLFLGASGLLNEEIGGPSIYPPIPDDVKAAGYGVGGVWTETEAPEKYRRGIYVVNRRTVPYPVSMAFDQANPNECTARRESSNTPLQPLALLNNPVFAECTAALAGRLAAEQGTLREKIEFGFRLCLGRKPTRGESDRLERLYRDAQKKGGASGDQAWRDIAEVMLNLDEFLTRE